MRQVESLADSRKTCQEPSERRKEKQVPLPMDPKTRQHECSTPFGITKVGIAAVAVLLLYEHALVRPDDLTRVNLAFFHVNVIISMGLLVFGLADLVL